MNLDRGIVPILASALVITACSNNKPITEADRDIEGRFNGTWRAVIKGTEQFQSYDRWELNCEVDVEASILLHVEDGVVRYQEQTGFISTAGQFVLSMPTTKWEATAPRWSERGLNDGSITLILRGNLSAEKQSGKFVRGIADLNDRGCVTRVKYEKLA